jgi:hypothetical protein
MATENSKVTDRTNISDLFRKCFSTYKLKERRIIEDLLSDRLKAFHDKDIDTLLSNHTPAIRWRSLSERELCDVIDPEQYTGADTVIAREMDEIITFA